MTVLARGRDINRNRRTQGLPGRRWAVVGALPALLLLLLPVIPIIPMSFTSSGVVLFPPSDWGLGAYRALFNDPSWVQVFYFSLKVAGLTVVLSVVAASLAAIGLSRGSFRGERVVTALIIAPLSIPLVVLGLAVFQFFAQYGLNGVVWGIALAHALLGVPYVFLTVRAALSRLDISLIRSAVSLGAGAFSVLRWVYLPAILPALASGAVLAFAVSFDDVVLSLFLSGPDAVTLPVKMFSELRYNLSPVLLAVSTLLLGGVVLVAFIGFGTVMYRQSRSEVAGRQE